MIFFFFTFSTIHSNGTDSIFTQVLSDFENKTTWAELLEPAGLRVGERHTESAQRVRVELSTECRGRPEGTHGRGIGGHGQSPQPRLAQGG